MSNMYEVFNIKSDKEFSDFLNKLDITTNDLLNITSISENINLSLQNKRNKIIEYMAGTTRDNYHVCLEQLKKNSPKRVLKESLNLNQVMELNELVGTIAKKYNVPNCAKGIYNIISTKLNADMANAFLGMVQQSEIKEDNLKFDTSLMIDGQNLAMAIYKVKNDIEMFINSVQEPSKDEAKDETKDETKDDIKENANKATFKKTLIKENNSNAIIDKINQLIDSSNNEQSLQSIIKMIDNQLSSSQSKEYNNILSELKSKAQSKLNTKINGSSAKIEESIEQDVVASACGENTFDGLCNGLKPTVINITVNKETGEIEEIPSEQVQPIIIQQPQEVEPTTANNAVYPMPVQNIELQPTEIDAPILQKPNVAYATSALTALSSHMNCQKSCSRENNIEELETIKTLLNQLDDYFTGVLSESKKPHKKETVFDHSWYEVKGQKYPKRNKEGVLIKETCSAGATCAASVASVPSNMGAPKRRKKKKSCNTPDVNVFKESVLNNIPCIVNVDNNKIAYKIYDGQGYMYINEGLVKVRGRKNIIEALYDFINDDFKLDIFEEFTPYQLDILFEEEEINSMETPLERKQQEEELDNEIRSNSNLKVAVTNDEDNSISDEQEIIGIDDSNEDDKKYVTRNPLTNDIKVTNSSNIKIMNKGL